MTCQSLAIAANLFLAGRGGAAARVQEAAARGACGGAGEDGGGEGEYATEDGGCSTINNIMGLAYLYLLNFTFSIATGLDDLMAALQPSRSMASVSRSFISLKSSSIPFFHNIFGHPLDLTPGTSYSITSPNNPSSSRLFT